MRKLVLAGGSGSGADGGGSSGGPYVDDVFSSYVYAGKGSLKTVENGIDLANEGGLVWIKNRTSGALAARHVLTDTEMAKGVNGIYPFLSSDMKDPLNPADQGNISVFNENGFSLSGNYDWHNKAGQDYVSWTFRKAPKFFDCITYTGTGVARDIPHNLGIEPGMVIVKRTDSTSDWYVWHKNGGDYASLVNARGQLNETDPFRVGTEFQDSLMTDSAFGLGSSNGSNSSGGEYVAYVFAHDDSEESMIQCGSFASNAGEFIDLGWEPQWVIAKGATGDSWWIFDSIRGWGADTDSTDAWLSADTSNAELAASSSAGLRPNGFISFDGGGNEYIYMAIRRPNKPAEEFDPEELFAVDTMGSTGDGKPPAFRSPLPIDMAIRSDTGGASHEIASRLTAGNWMYTDQSAAESSINNYADFDFQNGWSNSGTTISTYVSHMWRRAPGFFDVVAYEGDGQAGREVPHNLGVAPEMMWVKNRDVGENWVTNDPSQANPWSGYLNLNNDTGFTTSSNIWNDTAPTSEVFSVNSLGVTNAAGKNYIAYLFASVPGISKVGSYTGNGGSQDIDCGFTHGAKCLLVKRADGTGDWVWHWPSNSGDALKYTLKLNSTDKFASQYAVLPIPSGFSASGDICNIDGAEYIFYAIA